jgi:hypothetical protein
MASVLYNEAKRAILAGECDMNANDIRARLVMTDSTADSQNDGVVTLSNITTQDKADATGYADVACGSETVTKVDASDLAKFTTSDIVFSGLTPSATRDYLGIILYKYVSGSDAADLAIAFIEFTANVSKAATEVTVECPANGWFYLS